MTTGAVTIYEDENFGGRSKALAPGGYRFFTPDDFNDVVSSIQIPSGLAAQLFEHADDGGGYGISIDLLEDCPDLSVYGFNDKISYANVFSIVDRPGFVWARSRITNGEFIPGHWERQRANGVLPDNSTAVVSPPYAPHPSTAVTVLQIDGTQTLITFLGGQSGSDAAIWEHAVADQMGVIGSDFRGPEEIGSAAFERASNNIAIPDNLNFWYPQKQPRDHRSVVYFKRTLAGKVDSVHIANINGTYEDHDVNIDVVPNEKYKYLITDGHPREYTDIMSAQWNLSLHQLGKPDCDDSESIAESALIEAEIQPDSDVHSATAQTLNDLILARGPQDICIYGVWIYDKGHCCHSEIHPAEQIWWRDDVSANQRKYTFNLFCDASKRFWWRDQMDDGTKLKPWGAPPITGVFAIAFETELGKPAVTFEVSNISDFNVAVFPNGNQVYNLMYQNNVLVTFVPHNDAFKVSFENVGLTSNNKIRGFLVIETVVGTVTQTTTRLVIPNSNPQLAPIVAEIPPGTDVNTIDQRFEREAFKKVEGHYMFAVSQTNPHPDITHGGVWNSDFLAHRLRAQPTP